VRNSASAASPAELVSTAPYLYRRRDRLERIHTAETQPRDTPGTGPAVTRASLQADLLAAQQRCARMAARTQQLEQRLSELLG
jgi:hypothetical protein